MRKELTVALSRSTQRFASKTLISLVVALCILGCEKPVDLTYRAKSFEPVNAAIVTVPFEDARRDGIEPQVINGTGSQNFTLNQSIANYVEEGVALELRQMRVSRRGAQACTLGGEVNDMKIYGKTGAVIQLETTITFTLTRADGVVLLNKSENAVIESLDRMDFVAAAINSSIYQTFHSFRNDPTIRDRLEMECPTSA